MTYVFLFYPRRRRHTSWPRDWSSDVCSSDLEVALVALLRRRPGRERLARNARGVLLARPGRLRRLVRRALVLRCLRLGVRLLVPGALLRLLGTEAGGGAGGQTSDIPAPGPAVRPGR